MIIEIKPVKMAYKIKRTRFPRGYWREEELKHFREKYKGKHIPFKEITKEGTKYMAGTEEQVHKKGNVVYYKEGIVKVRKVTKRGLWVEPFKKPTEKSIGYPSGKLIFIPEKEVEKHIYPLTTKIPVYLSPPFQIFEGGV